MLPDFVRSYKIDKGWQYAAKWNNMVPYEGSGILHPQYRSHSDDCDTEADARAKMPIYLIENKLITV
jgi:hypothetical protein